MTAEKWQREADALIADVGVTVRKYRSNMTGTAYVKSKDWGIECPEPRGPMSFAVLAHEVGHQRLHRSGSKPRWVEEVEAWEFALDAMETAGATDAQYQLVLRRAYKSVAYAFVKARRRGVTAETIRERFPEWWQAAFERRWLDLL